MKYHMPKICPRVNRWRLKLVMRIPVLVSDKEPLEIPLLHIYFSNWILISILCKKCAVKKFIGSSENLQESQGKNV